MKKGEGRTSSLDNLIRKEPPLSVPSRPIRERKRDYKKIILLLVLAMLFWTGIFVYISGSRTAVRNTGVQGEKMENPSDTDANDVKTGEGESAHKKIRIKATERIGAPAEKTGADAEKSETEVIIHDRDVNMPGRKGPINLGTSIELVD